MGKTMKSDCSAALPEPIALTPDQLKQIATATAGGLLLGFSSVVRAGGIPPVITTGVIAPEPVLAY
jgi:hypothetical protein